MFDLSKVTGHKEQIGYDSEGRWLLKENRKDVGLNMGHYIRERLASMELRCVSVRIIVVGKVLKNIYLDKITVLLL